MGAAPLFNELLAAAFALGPFVFAGLGVIILISRRREGVAPVETTRLIKRFLAVVAITMVATAAGQLILVGAWWSGAMHGCAAIAAAVLAVMPISDNQAAANFKRDANFCGRCGYPTEGLVADACPECGWKLPAAAADDGVSKDEIRMPHE